ncbi:endonuclease/exonuclease/phosphatase family protein [Jannaschia sp. KMU-145]|uniref:endonuclease/exonuclease/phosphatase family protein n=1 Tax=Jannaschia halovivens TaxID=3388667 RepID=UPI00396B177E
MGLLRPVAIVLCLLGLAAGPWPLRLAFGAVALAGAATILAHLMTQAPGGDLRIYSKNVWFLNEEIDALAADILAAEVDAVFLQEVSADQAGLPEALAAAFPHQHRCQPSRWSGIVVASKYPFDGTPRCSEARGVAAAPIRIGGQRIWLAAIHLPWPWPHDSAANDAAALDLLGSLDGPVVLGGDFNIFPWTGRVARIADLTDTRVAGPMRATFSLLGLPLPIDIVLAPGGGSVAARPWLGSDHRGIVADVALAPDR